jgi:ABC-2 type transport system permease protein
VTRLLVAESVKVFTTRLWWALLIPAAMVAAVLGFAGAAIAGLPDLVRDAGFVTPAVALSMPLAMQQTTIFAVVLGVVGGAGEFRHRTVTTTYLTAASRGAVLAAKTVVYAALGLLYGAVTALLCAAGAMLDSGADSFPGAADTLTIAAAGALGVVAWCVLGVGIGTLVTNQVAVLVLVLVYKLFVESMLSLLLGVSGEPAEDVVKYLPGPTAASLQTDHGITVFARAFGDEAFVTREIVETFVGTPDQVSWWGGGLLFAVYTAAVVAAGWVVGLRRDIT